VKWFLYKEEGLFGVLHAQSLLQWESG